MRTLPATRKLTAVGVREIMARLLGGPMPIQPRHCAACLGVRLAGHRGTPTDPKVAHEQGYKYEIAYDERQSMRDCDREIARKLARYIVGVCEGDVDDAELIEGVCFEVFGVVLRKPVPIPVRPVEHVIAPVVEPKPKRSVFVSGSFYRSVRIANFRREPVPVYAVECKTVHTSETYEPKPTHATEPPTRRTFVVAVFTANYDAVLCPTDGDGDAADRKPDIRLWYYGYRSRRR
jgi:hypothetical protein